ncbi:hypothetical protein Syun_007228 [Stephania yunnanensis]|uniref:Uncharacterized protein n=1 Tax=Stephania yunnanensis TaxID=152371 RepID=A0AAP0KY27_9MAGN
MVRTEMKGPQNFHEMDCHIDDADVRGYDPTPYREMLHNAAGPSFNWNVVEESPNPQARQLYDMIDASREQLWPGCETMTTLSAMARLLAIKSEHHISEQLTPCLEVGVVGIVEAVSLVGVMEALGASGLGVIEVNLLLAILF